ncbi:MAG: helix-turn-helix domain-containing protein [Rhodospirillales bacterium]
MSGSAPSIAEIQQAVAAHFGTRIQDMRSPRRAIRVARPRQIAMYLASEMTVSSLPTIGRAFDRDHTTVMHAVAKIKELLAQGWMTDTVDQIKRKLSAALATKEMQAACDIFNIGNPIGAAVLVWRYVKEGPGEPAVTTGPAFILFGHTAVVHVTGGRGCVALSHVEPEKMEFDAWYARAGRITLSLQPGSNRPCFEPWWRDQFAAGVSPLDAVLENHNHAIGLADIREALARERASVPA